MNPLDLLSIFEASTPDGRWNLLQEWLKNNPDWKDTVDHWLSLDPDAAVIQLQIDIAKRLKMPLSVFSAMLTTEMRVKATAAIESLQTLYKERAGVNNQPKKLKKGKSSNDERQGSARTRKPKRKQ